MHPTKTFLISILVVFASISTRAQYKDIQYFGSYSYGFGNLTAKVDPSLSGPMLNEVKQLKSGTSQQVELGVYFNTVGVAILHNSYRADAATIYENMDFNSDGILENGALSNKLTLDFNGAEVLYRVPLMGNKLEAGCKAGLGIQSYKMNTEQVMAGANPGTSTSVMRGHKVTYLAGLEVNYQVWKWVSIGLETSIIPGSYKNLASNYYDSYRFSDNVTRLSSGVKIRLSL